MTFRTFDIDSNELGGATSTFTETFSGAETASRHTRSRRRNAVMGHRSVGARIRGFGI